ncbi:MAG: response regulator [Gallionella sp.]|nr:response regulator [Gallionella sp.]
MGLKENTLLLVDDDCVFCQVLSRALEKRGFHVTVAHSVEQALPLAENNPPHYAVLDLKMNGASGLSLIPVLRRLNVAARIVVLTGYASVATAVEAIKLGATQYLSKSASTDEIVTAFGCKVDTDVLPETRVLSLDQLEWDHIQNVMREQNNNITFAARALNMHRRTLQRKLAKLVRGGE